MKKHYLVFATASLLFACNQPTIPPDDEEDADTLTSAQEEEQETEPSLTKVWETDTVLTTNESVLYAEDEDILYVSNIAGQPTEKDGVGFISKLGTDGSIQELKWVTGLDAPKGMGINDGKLYVTNIDELVEINIDEGSIANRYPVEEAQFLNDVVINEGKVYFSDMETGKLHVLEDGEVSTLAEDRDEINGLAFNHGELYALDGDGLRRYPLHEDADPDVISDGVTGGDGLVVVDDHTYIASRWQGEIYLVQNGEATKLLDTQDQDLNTADIGYIPNENLVLVPTFFGNKVAAYKLNY